MTLGEQIRKGSLWLIAGSVSSRIIEFIFGVILARLLVPADFGLLVTVSIFTGVAGFFAGGGMGAALVRAKHVSNKSFSTVFSMQLSICILLYIFFYFISSYFAIWFDEQLYEQLLKVSALSFLLRPFMNVPNAILQREMRFKEKAHIHFFTILFTGCVSVILAYQGLMVWSLVIGGLLGSVFTIILLYSRIQWRPAIYFSKNIAKELGSFGAKLAISHLLDYIKQQVSNFMISFYSGPNDVGLFNKGDSLSKLPQRTIARSIYQTLFRALSTVNDDLDKSKYIFYRTITLQTVYITPFYVMLWWLSYSFIITVYGNNWIDTSDILQILSMTGVLMLASPSGALIEAQNKVGKEIIINIEVLALLIAAIFIGFNWGLIGVTWSVVIVRYYNIFRLYLFASSLVDGKAKDLIKALIPGYLLNIILFVFIFSIDNIYLSSIEKTLPYVYLLVVGCSGGLFYFIMFMTVPIKTLKEEQIKWKAVISKYIFRRPRIKKD